jgi:ribosome-binding protein aMBF1 (putative translation factor)
MKDHRNRPSKEWYREQIAKMGDVDVRTAAGTVEEGHRDKPQLTRAFSILVRLERRNKKLSVATLAESLQIEEEELRLIEHDQTYRARPRTIVNIAKHFGLPITKVMKLAGATVSNDERFTAEVQRFAAFSDDLGVLTNEERRVLNEFVEFLKDSA